MHDQRAAQPERGIDFERQEMGFRLVRCIAKAHRELGWTSLRGLEMQIEDTVRWRRALMRLISMIVRGHAKQTPEAATAPDDDIVIGHEKAHPITVGWALRRAGGGGKTA